MRRSGHPSRPRAITCCFFSSLKTLLIPTKATALRRNQRPRASFSLAGFQVTLIGRFWVTAEGIRFLLLVDARFRFSFVKNVRQFVFPVVFDEGFDTDVLESLLWCLLVDGQTESIYGSLGC